MAPHPQWRKEPHNIHQAHKKKICEICGAIGFQQAILTCNRCKNVDVHIYCVLGYRENTPKVWCCEECDIDKGVSSHGLGNEYSEGSMLQASAKKCQTTMGPKKHSKFSGGHCINWEKEVQTGKTKYLPVKQALGLFKKSGCPLKNTSFSRVVSTKPMATVTPGSFSKPRAHISNYFPEMSTVPRGLRSARYKKPQNLLNARIIEQSKRSVQSSKGPGGLTILENRNSNVVNASGMMNPVMTHPCDPALVPSWKGRFDILDCPEFACGMLNNCIQAYPPSRVRRKVYEFSELLPNTLKFELVPRGVIWTSLFNNYCPGKEDLGLYFLARERERSGKYTALVEYMNMKDLVMRTLINDIELLVLASTVLCNDSQQGLSETTSLPLR